MREFVESRAKILLIVSIPQDVFIASGATVKPSLLFFKKFTEKEATEYAEIKKNAEATVDAKYAEELSSIESKLAKRGKEAVSKEEKKELTENKKQILDHKIDEIRSIIKEKFDYEIPVAEVKKAGISTTGTPIENELIPLAEEFTPYRKEMHLWEVPEKENKYKLSDDSIIR